MSARGNSSVKPQKISHDFVRVLASAILEWLLIFLLFIDAIFSYLITRFAHYCELRTPCLLCSRLDHVLGNKKLKCYWDLICSNHKSEISSFVLCHVHNKLIDVHGMCENCLFSYAMVNKSNAETDKLLVGKLGEDLTFNFDKDLLLDSHKNSQPRARPCSCCNEQWIARGFTQTLIHSKSKSTGSEPLVVDVPLSDADKHSQHDTETTKKPSVVYRATHPKSRGLDLSHVGYTKLKVTSDKKSEVVLFDDDNASTQICKIDGHKEDLAAQCVQLEKLVDLVFAPEPSAPAELISLDDVPPSPKAEKTSINVSNKSKLMFVDDVSPSSKSGKTSDVSKEDMLIHVDVPPSPESTESPVDIFKERKLSSLCDVLLSSNAGKSSVDISEECKLISLDDGTPSPKNEKISVDVYQMIASLFL